MWSTLHRHNMSGVVVRSSWERNHHILILLIWIFFLHGELKLDGDFWDYSLMCFVWNQWTDLTHNLHSYDILRGIDGTTHRNILKSPLLIPISNPNTISSGNVLLHCSTNDRRWILLWIPRFSIRLLGFKIQLYLMLSWIVSN